jgi:hypothetical protein
MTSLRRTPLRAAALVAGALLALEACVAPADETSTEAVNPSHGEALTMSACGTVLGSFDGTDAFSNGGDTSTGNSCDGWGTYGLQYQCVELVMRHFETHWGLSWHGNAKDLLTNAPKSSVDVFSNGDGAHPPVPGDMIVWTTGAYGHVALVTSVHAGGIDILEQNVKGDGHATLSWDGATIGVRWGSWKAAGWAHAKANGAIVGPVGTTWSCNDSAYQGQQLWTCSAGNLHKCDNGAAVEQTCSDGCDVNAVGSDDTCKTATPPPPPPPGWNCNDSAYQGAQVWTCSAGNLFKCVGGVAQEQTCSDGCNVNAIGTDDTCKTAAPPPPPPPSWSCANSSYNGAQYWTCSGGNVYKCVGGVPEEQVCGNGCKVNPVGTDDVCQ